MTAILTTACALISAPATRPEGTGLPLTTTRDLVFGARRTCDEAPREWFEAYLEDPSLENRDRILEHYLPLVRLLAIKLAKKTPASVELGDLCSAGVFGLLGALERYDPSRGVQFKTYCSLRVHGEMVDQLRKDDWVPRLVRTKAATVAQAIAELQHELGREPSDVELAERLGVTLDGLAALVAEATVVEVNSLSDEWRDETGQAARTVDLIRDRKAQDPVIVLELRDEIAETMGILDERERLVWMLYGHEEWTMGQISRCIGLSESGVSQLWKRIRRRVLQAAGMAEPSASGPPK